MPKAARRAWVAIELTVWSVLRGKSIICLRGLVSLVKLVNYLNEANNLKVRAVIKLVRRRWMVSLIEQEVVTDNTSTTSRVDW